MKYNRLSRRHFLQGAGGSLLALPLLPSLMPREAQAAPPADPRFLVTFYNGHGGINLQNVFPVGSNPAVSNVMQSKPFYAAQNHSIKYARLTSLLTTRASNVPYLGQQLDAQIGDYLNQVPNASSYGLDPSGADFDGGAARVTPIIGSFTPTAMLNKMNLIAGVDYMYNSGHNTGHTGNFCNYSGNNPSSANPGGGNPGNAGMPNIWVPTVDNVAAAYAGFYANTPIVQSIVMNGQYLGSDGGGSFLSARMASGKIAPNGNIMGSVGQAFSLLFGSLVTARNPATGNTNKSEFILNKIHDDYVRVARGAYGPGRRIGKDDRNRFEEFISNLSSLITGVQTYAACAIPNFSTTDASHLQTTTVGLPQTFAEQKSACQLYNQLITAAFQCGLTQCVTFPIPSLIDSFYPSGSTYTSTFNDGVTTPDTHQAVYHQHNFANRQAMLVNTQRFFFQNLFLDLMQKLDAVPNAAGTGTLLDQSFLWWTQECGFNTHEGFSIPIIQAGGAGGFIKTGNFIDYRNVNQALVPYNVARNHIGTPWNRFLGTLLQAMGVPPSFYELKASLFTGTTGRIPTTAAGTVPGYGHPYQQQFKVVSGGPLVYPYDYQINDMSVPLPVLT